MTNSIAALSVVAAGMVTVPLAPRMRPQPPAAQDLPSPIAQSRIRLDIRGGQVLTTMDFTIPGSAKTRQDLDIHVAYGGPGQPTAVDAQLLATPAGYLVAPIEQAGTKVQTSPSLHGPEHAIIHIGRSQMAGTLVHVSSVTLAEKLAATGQATLRVRELRPVPPQGDDGTVEVVVRLGTIEDKPFIIGLLEVASDQAIDRVEARYCGVGSTGQKLFVAGQTAQGGVIPALSTRRVGDDLCIRFGVNPDKDEKGRSKGTSGASSPPASARP